MENKNSPHVVFQISFKLGWNPYRQCSGGKKNQGRLQRHPAFDNGVTRCQNTHCLKTAPWRPLVVRQYIQAPLEILTNKIWFWRKLDCLMCLLTTGQSGLPVWRICHSVIHASVKHSLCGEPRVLQRIGSINVSQKINGIWEMVELIRTEIGKNKWTFLH